LESLKEQLNAEQFFKVNRQIIINIVIIKRVHSSFNGKLRLETQPSHSEDIIIGKDKAAAFKRWLDR
jgi:two-component system response regulator LytT